MKLENLLNEYLVNDELLLDLDWINNPHLNHTYNGSERMLQSAGFALDVDEIENIINNLPLDPNKETEAVEITTSKEFAFIDPPSFIYDMEREILELDVAPDYFYV